MRVKHFRLEKDGTRYLLALLPISFGKLADDHVAPRGGIATDGWFMLAIDTDLFVEFDPFAWVEKDWDLVYAHFFLREKAKELRGGQILRTHEIRAEYEELVQALAGERGIVPPGIHKSAAADRDTTPIAAEEPAS